MHPGCWVSHLKFLYESADRPPFIAIHTASHIWGKLRFLVFCHKHTGLYRVQSRTSSLETIIDKVGPSSLQRKSPSYLHSGFFLIRNHGRVTWVPWPHMAIAFWGWKRWPKKQEKLLPMPGVKGLPEDHHAWVPGWLWGGNTNLYRNNMTFKKPSLETNKLHSFPNLKFERFDREVLP